MQTISILTWNLNSRTNDLVINRQIGLIRNYMPDIVTLQEITVNSLEKIRKLLIKIGYNNIVSSFDICNHISLLAGKRKYGQIIASKLDLTSDKPSNFDIPFIERVLTVNLKLNGRKIKIHTTHAPPGSSNGIVKINHFNGIYNYFLNSKDDMHILSGDFNTPKHEHIELGLITWGQTLTKDNKVIFSRSKESDGCSAEEWDEGERKIMLGLPDIGLKDVYRELYSYEIQDYSWILKRKGEIISQRRYDHIFASTKFNYNSAEYIHTPLKTKISDHSALLVHLDI
tara:strand:- start:1313 stop:2167 length:855 start_codon:yes stop_codon:yes gene_type:complete